MLIPSGAFVIEASYMKGLIFGGSKSRNWTRQIKPARAEFWYSLGGIAREYNSNHRGSRALLSWKGRRIIRSSPGRRRRRSRGAAVPASRRSCRSRTWRAGLMRAIPRLFQTLRNVVFHQFLGFCCIRSSQSCNDYC